MTMHQPCCQVMHDAKAEKYFSVFFVLENGAEYIIMEAETMRWILWADILYLTGAEHS